MSKNGSPTKGVIWELKFTLNIIVFLGEHLFKYKDLIYFLIGPIIYTDKRGFIQMSKYRVVKDYHPTPHTILKVKAGDILSFERRSSEWQGWIWCKNDKGQAAWVPEKWVKFKGNQCTIQKDYSSRELVLNQGDILNAAFEESGWIWVPDHNGIAGWAPLNHLEEM